MTGIQTYKLKPGKPTYYDNWSGYKSVRSAYPGLPPQASLIYAGYTYKSYSGAALVVWITADGRLMENNDSHCSCHGLTNWSPEVTLLDALKMRKGWPGLAEALERVKVVKKG